MQLWLYILCVTTIVWTEAAKSNIKSLTETAGQEIIEIGNPIKDLPGDLEEEPSAERDDNSITQTTVGGATSNAKRTGDGRRRFKDIESRSKQEEEEAKIEKELAEIYKDNSDYKSAENLDQKEEQPTTIVEQLDDVKPIARANDEIKFQPDSDSQEDINKFRTSVDDIKCANEATERLLTVTPGSASSSTINIAVLCFASIPLVLNI